jgi:hypothetical protein
MVGGQGTQGGQSKTLKHLKMGHFLENALFQLFLVFYLTLKDQYYQKLSNDYMETSSKGSWPPMGPVGGH